MRILELCQAARPLAAYQLHLLGGGAVLLRLLGGGAALLRLQGGGAALLRLQGGGNLFPFPPSGAPILLPLQLRVDS